MPTYTQDNRYLKITLEGLDENALLLAEFEGTEEISEVFSYEALLLSEKPFNAQDLLGKVATVSVLKNDGATRYFNAIVTSFCSYGKYHVNNDLLHYKILLEPRLSLLRNNRNCRVFHEKNSIEIIEQILHDWNILFDDSNIDHNEFYKHEHFVQFDESDFDFISRLMEKEGVFYYFEHGISVLEDGSESSHHKMILMDSNPKPSKDSSTNSELTDKKEANLLRYSPDTKDNGVYHWAMNESLGFQSVDYSDYDFKSASDNYSFSHPIVQNSALDGETKDKMNLYRHYGTSRTVLDRKADMNNYGSKLVERHAENARSSQFNWTGRSQNYNIATGFPFALSDFPGNDNIKAFVKKTVIHCKTTPYISGRIQSDNEFNYHCEFKAHNSDVKYAPTLKTSPPTINSLQQARVITLEQTDDKGKTYYPEIECILDDNNTSCRVYIEYNWNNKQKIQRARVSHNWAGNDYGQFNLPRKDQEVIVAFINGDPNNPIIVGALFNSENPVPIDLSNDRSKYATVFRTQTVEETGEAAATLSNRAADPKIKDVVMDINDLAKEDKQKNYNEISIYDMKGEFEEAKKSKGSKFLNAISGADEINPLEHIGELVENAKEYKKHYEDNPFEGINFYSNNQMVSQAGQTQVIQAGRDIILEAANSITFKVGRNIITMTNTGIDVRSKFAISNSSIWNMTDRDIYDMRTLDSYLHLSSMQSYLYGVRTINKAFMEAFMGTIWGSKLDCLLMDSKMDATTLSFTAGANKLKRLETITELVNSVTSCIPFVDEAGETISSTVLAVLLIKEILECIRKDAKYFLTLKEAKSKVTPEGTESDEGKKIIKAEEIDFISDPLGGLDDLIFDEDEEEDELLKATCSNIIIKPTLIKKFAENEEIIILDEKQENINSKESNILNKEENIGENTKNNLDKTENNVEDEKNNVSKTESNIEDEKSTLNETKTTAIKENTDALVEETTPVKNQNVALDLEDV